MRGVPAADADAAMGVPVGAWACERLCAPGRLREVGVVRRAMVLLVVVGASAHARKAP